MALPDKVLKLIERYEENCNILAAISSSDYLRTTQILKDQAEIEKVVLLAKDYTKKSEEIESLYKMMRDDDVEDGLRNMAIAEINDIEVVLKKIEHDIKMLLLPKDADDDRGAILEIRAGAGGDEATLFVSVLFRMYKRYAEIKGWKFEVMSICETGICGYKYASACISGNDVFAHLKFECGVHRVQRVPVTETNGRIHTSTVTVAVLPEVEEIDVFIDQKDLRIDVYRSSGAGGQHVNTTDSAVRITHIPTGIVVVQQDEKSQHKNKAKALKILRSRLYDLERVKKNTERSDMRKSQVGTGDRSERIRTYNYTQNRVTDHRINLTLYSLIDVLDGNGIDELVNSLIVENQASD